MSHILQMALIAEVIFFCFWLYDYLYFVLCMYRIWIVQLEYAVHFVGIYCSSTIAILKSE